MQAAWKEHLAPTLLFPLAALLVLLKSEVGAIPDFGRDWRYVLGGPIGVLVWYAAAVFGRSWLAIFGGYALGAVACLVAVLLLGVIARRITRDWD